MPITLLDVTAFNRVADEDNRPAAALADWSSDTDERQETIAKRSRAVFFIWDFLKKN